MIPLGVTLDVTHVMRQPCAEVKRLVGTSFWILSNADRLDVAKPIQADRALPTAEFDGIDGERVLSCSPALYEFLRGLRGHR
jgi:hypothetical protein